MDEHVVRDRQCAHRLDDACIEVQKVLDLDRIELHTAK
jgi:hypothetical protein